MNSIKEKYGPWVIITGASSGIGEEFARKLSTFGLNLILVARRKERMEILSEELKSTFQNEIIIIPIDLSDDNFLETIITKTENIEIGLLINNAGQGSANEFSLADSAEDIKMIKVNCLASIALTHHFVRHMIERKKGGIIFLGSLLSYQPTPYSAAYSATKVFNTFLGEALWYELKKYNIDVLSLNPGGTDTDFIRLSSNMRKSIFIRTTQNVVNTALNSLGKKPSVVDGNINKIIVFMGKFLPRKYLVKLSGFISRKLYEKRY